MDILEHNGLMFEDMYYDKDDISSILKMQRILLIKKNILFSIQECINIWQKYSWDLQASWLIFPDKDEEILTDIESSDFFTSYEDYCL